MRYVCEHAHLSKFACVSVYVYGCVRVQLCLCAHVCISVYARCWSSNISYHIVSRDLQVSLSDVLQRQAGNQGTRTLEQLHLERGTPAFLAHTAVMVPARPGVQHAATAPRLSGGTSHSGGCPRGGSYADCGN